MHNHDAPSATAVRPCPGRAPRRREWQRLGLAALAIAGGLVLGACSTTPLQPFAADGPPLILVPASQAGVQDQRGRFREVFCQVLEARGSALPDYRTCEEALTLVGEEPPGTGVAVDLGPSERGLVAAIVPGVGWDCFSEWLDLKSSVPEHLRQFGYDQIILEVDSLSSSANNARQIRDAVMRLQPEDANPRLVLIGYSKGAPDILEAIASFPEIGRRVAAVVSAAGAIGGSPLADAAKQSQVNLLQSWPGAHCSPGDGGALESLRPSRRRAWLAQHSLPEDVPYYSLVTLPQPDRISAVLKPTYRMLSWIDGRNDGQLLFYDQVIPGSKLLGFVNADHWALAVPITRSGSPLRSAVVTHNDYPREALLEGLLRFLEWDLAQASK